MKQSVFIFIIILFSNISFGSNIILLSKDSVPQYKEVIKDIALQAFKVIYSDLWNDTFEKSGLEKIDKWLDEYQNDSDKMFWVIAFQEYKLIGWALFIKNDQKNNCAIVKQISVKPNQWRRGIGRKLVFSIFDYWKECKVIALTTRKSNKISHKFYKNLGFSESYFMPEQDSTKEMKGYEYIHE